GESVSDSSVCPECGWEFIRDDFYRCPVCGHVFPGSARKRRRIPALSKGEAVGTGPTGKAIRYRDERSDLRLLAKEISAAVPAEHLSAYERQINDAIMGWAAPPAGLHPPAGLETGTAEHYVYCSDPGGEPLEQADLQGVTLEHLTGQLLALAVRLRLWRRVHGHIRPGALLLNTSTNSLELFDFDLPPCQLAEYVSSHTFAETAAPEQLTNSQPPDHLCDLFGIGKTWTALADAKGVRSSRGYMMTLAAMSSETPEKRPPASPLGLVPMQRGSEPAGGGVTRPGAAARYGVLGIPLPQWELQDGGEEAIITLRLLGTSDTVPVSVRLNPADDSISVGVEPQPVPPGAPCTITINSSGGPWEGRVLVDYADEPGAKPCMIDVSVRGRTRSPDEARSKKPPEIRETVSESAATRAGGAEATEQAEPPQEPPSEAQSPDTAESSERPGDVPPEAPEEEGPEPDTAAAVETVSEPLAGADDSIPDTDAAEAEDDATASADDALPQIGAEVTEKAAENEVARNKPPDDAEVYTRAPADADTQQQADVWKVLLAGIGIGLAIAVVAYLALSFLR
ncbi:MAG: hypothetical protein R6V19_10540, partial [Armatimonadota bacterium]